jgi:hypothetical protein
MSHANNITVHVRVSEARRRKTKINDDIIMMHAGGSGTKRKCRRRRAQNLQPLTVEFGHY